MSQFNFQSALSSSSSSSSSSPRSSTDTALPFPTPLPRSDFLTRDFSPSAYLSDLAPSRHQVLEDLRSDLRVRSQQLSRELLDLVNAHYADFLGLGGNLRGGKDKVEEVKVGLMGFQREVQGVRDKLKKKENDIKALVEERKQTKGNMEKGWALLEWEAKIETLEMRLSLVGSGQVHTKQTVDVVMDAEESESDEEDFLSLEYKSHGDVDPSPNKMSMASLAKLRRYVQDFRFIQQSALQLDWSHPFILAQQPRLMRIRTTLLLDLSNCLQFIPMNSKRKLEVITMYCDMDAGREAIEAIRISARTK